MIRPLTAVACSLLVILAVVGCGDSRGSNQGGDQGGVGSTLVSIGHWFTYAGSVALGIGALGVVACFVWPVLAGFREFLGDLAVVGLAAVLLGCSFIWLGTHAWLLAVVVALLLGLLLFRYRARIPRFLRLKKASAKPVTPPLPPGIA